MPRATVSTEAIRKELKTCPGGWIEIRPMAFGEMLQRRDKAIRNTQLLDPKMKQGDSVRTQIEIMNEWSRQYDFKNCIMDHNLEDDRGNKLDFGNPMTLQVLDPKIGAEIENYIDDLNQEDFDGEGFTLPSDSSSNNGMNLSTEDSD